MSSRYGSGSEVIASESLENLEEMFLVFFENIFYRFELLKKLNLLPQT